LIEVELHLKITVHHWVRNTVSATIPPNCQQHSIPCTYHLLRRHDVRGFAPARIQMHAKGEKYVCAILRNRARTPLARVCERYEGSSVLARGSSSCVYSRPRRCRICICIFARLRVESSRHMQTAPSILLHLHLYWCISPSPMERGDFF